MATELTEAEAMEEIARRSPQAVGLITRCLEHSEREREAIERMVTRSLERERDEWRDRALQAESRLERIRENLLGLMY